MSPERDAAGHADRGRRRSSPTPVSRRILAEIADLLELKGESSFKVGRLPAGGRLGGAQPGRRRGCLPRRPPAAAAGRRATASPASIAELAEHGTHRATTSASRPSCRRRCWRCAPSRASGRARSARSGGSSASPRSTELEAAAREGRLRQLRGLSAAHRGAHPRGHRPQRRRDRARRMLMGDARWLSARGSWTSSSSCPASARHVAAGSVRRRRETVGDLDILVETDRPAEVLAALWRLARPRRWSRRPGLRGGHDRVTRASCTDGPHVDVMTDAARAGSAATSSTSPVRPSTTCSCATARRQQGWSLSEHGLGPLPAAGEQSAAGHGADAAGLRTFASEAELYALPRPGRDPARAARGPRRDRGGRGGALPDARPPRATCAATATATRTGRTVASRSRSWSSRRAAPGASTRSSPTTRGASPSPTA